MEPAKAPTSNGGLTSAQFEHLLQRLAPDRECAGQAYEKLRRQLTRFFEWNCGSSAEDLVDATLDRVAQKLDEIEVHNLVAFAWGVARKVRHEADRKAARMVPTSGCDEEVCSGENGAAEEKIHQKIDMERQLRCLHRCVQRLGVEDRKLFLSYYRPGQDPEARQRLARSLGLTMNALRVRVNRLRERVEQCTEKYRSSTMERPKYIDSETLADRGNDE